MNKKQSKKIIATELDGTLLDINKKCSEETQIYLQKLKQEENVIATGRILNSAIRVTEGATFANYIIADAGGMIYDMTNKKEIQKVNISRKNIKKICSFYDDNFKYINLCDTKFCHRYTNDYYEDSEHVIEDKKQFLDECENIIHISVTLKDDTHIENLIEKMEKEIDDLDFKIMQDSFAKDRWIEISQKDVSKYKAIETIANIENIKNEDIIAFGDGLNDIEMIQKCGIGVAMGNSLEEVKNVADYTTLSHNENGIVYFLDKVF